MKCKFLIQLTLTSKCAVIIYVALYFLLSVTVNHIKGDYDILCQSPASAGRDSTWRCERCRWETEAASQFSWTACLFQAYDSLLYFYKSIRSEVWYFQPPLTQIFCLHKSLFPLKRSFCLSDSLIYFFSCVLVNTL